MATTPKGVRNELLTEINRDFTRFNKDFVTQLKIQTPVNTGTARRGWRNKYNGQVGKGPSWAMISNPVNYVGVLDTGTSKQAPNGIIEPAYKKTRKPK